MALSTMTLKGLDPDLIMDGATQRFIYSTLDPVIKFQNFSQFVPTSLVDSVINIESRNKNFAGFRLKHTTTFADTNFFGSCKFQSFVSDGAGSDIWGYDGANLKVYSTFYANMCAGLISWSANATSTPITSGVYAKALGTTTLASASKCATMPANNRLAFVPTDGSTQTISVQARASVSFQWAAAGTPLLNVSIYKNGSQVLPIASITGIAAANLYNVTAEIFTTMTNNDYLEVFVTANATNATGITVVHGTLSFKSI